MCRQHAAGCPGADLVDQRRRSVDRPGEPGGVCGLVEQRVAEGVVGRQPSGPLEGSRGRCVRAAPQRALGSLLKSGARGRVRADSGRGEVPGTPVCVPVGERARKCGVRPPALLGRGRVVDRRAGQGMPELHDPVAESHEPGSFAGCQVGELQTDRACGPRQHRELAAVAGRCEHQRVARALWERCGAVQERFGDPSRHRYRSG